MAPRFLAPCGPEGRSSEQPAPTKVGPTGKAMDMILYEGPSMLDGAPIVCVATGLRRKSQNAKTGAMVQLWILRADVHPLDAANTGADASICGTCPHRGPIGRRSCYVTLAQAPAAVWRTYRAGKYVRGDAGELAGRKVRLGAYGDPAALPIDLVRRICAVASGYTGYTHAWARALELAPYVMASADSPADRIKARMLGFRVFRVKRPDAPAMVGEIECLSTAADVSCADCGLCAGQSRAGKRDIWIDVHGSGARHFAAAA